MSDKQIKLGMTYKDLIDAISSDGLTVNSPNDITYEGDISIKNGNPLPLHDIHTAVFPETINEGEVWLLTKVIIKKVNSLKVDGVSVDPNSSPLLVNISDEKIWKFYFSSGSIIGSNIEYSVDLRFVFEQSLSSHRKTTRKLVQRVSALESSGGGGGGLTEDDVKTIVDEKVAEYGQDLTTTDKTIVGAINEISSKTVDKITYVDTCFDGATELNITDDSIGWADTLAISCGDTGVNTKVYYSVPIVAGDNVTFEVDDNFVRINATGGGGLELGEDEGTAYEGSKGRKLANDFSLLIQDTILPASTMLQLHETAINGFEDRISALEEGGGGGSSGGGSECACYGEPSIVLSLYMYDSVTFKNLTGVTRIDWGDGNIDDYSATPTTFTHTYEKYDMDLFYEVKIYGCTAIGDNAFWDTGNGGISNITISGDIKSIGKNAIDILSTTGYHPSGQASIVFTSDVPPKIANVKYMNRDENWEYFGEGDFPAEQTSYSSFSSEIQKIAIPTSAGLDAYSRYWMSSYDSILSPIVAQGSEGGFTPDQEMTINAIADMAAMNAIEYSATIGDIKDRVTALEEAGGGGSSGGGDEPSSGGTKLYKITGNAFENMGGPVTFNFQAVVSKDPSFLTVFDEIFDTFGMVSITLMPDDSGFYPIGVVKKDNSWKVYGFKEGNMTTSNANFLINFEIEEL